MADNYLENKYAEYQARKTSGTRTGHTTKTLHKTRRVFITGGAEGIGKAIVRAFRGAGHRVAFCDKNETWYIENCSGPQYVAIKVPDSMIFLEPNMAVIGRVDLDDKNIIASDKLIEVAQKGGTFVGDADKNIIDFRASYAGRLDRVDQRMVDGLNYLNKDYNYTAEQLLADNTFAMPVVEAAPEPEQLPEKGE